MSTASGRFTPDRGEDRARSARLERGNALAFAGVMAAVCALAVVAIIGPRLIGGRPAATDRVTLLIDSAAMAVALAIAVLCVVRWRAGGQSWILWIAGSGFTYALVTMSTGYVLPDLLQPEARPPVLLEMHPASRLVAVALLAQALRAGNRESVVRPLQVTAAAIAGIGVLTVLFQLAPPLGVSLSGIDDPLAANLDLGVGSIILIVVYVALGSAFLVRGRRPDSSLFGWFGVLLWAFGFAEVHRMTVPDGTAWSVGDSALRLAGMLVTAGGLTRDLLATIRDQGGKLLESVAIGAAAEARIRAAHAANEERAHEARNALAAIEGATRTLEHYRDRLDPDTRAALAQAITEEIARLQDLITGMRERSTPAPFAVERALRTVLTTAQSEGMEITIDIPTGLKAFGRPAETAEVVQNLLVNARRYAPGSPVNVHARAEQGGVVVRVDDHGPGVAPDERRLIFSRGVRGAEGQRRGSEGSGLGLYVSLELMRDQGGDLWVDDREGGGASFALWLPAHEPAEGEGTTAWRADWA